MKRLMSLLLALLCLCGPSQGMAKDDENSRLISLEGRGRLSSSVYLDGRLYLLLDGHPFRFRTEEGDITELTLIDRRTGIKDNAGANQLDGGMRLFTSDGKLFAVDIAQHAAIYPLAVEADALVLSDGLPIDIAPLMREEGFPMEPAQLLGFQGRLFVLTFAARGDALAPCLVSYDIVQGGEAKRHTNKNIWALTPYTDDKLLALVMDYQQRWDRSTNQVRNFELNTYDVATDTLSHYADSGVAFNADSPGVYFEGDTGKIYVQSGGSTYLHQENKKATPVTSAASGLGHHAPQTRLYFLPYGKLLAVNGHAIAVQTLNTHRAPLRQLTILGAYAGDRIHRQTVADMGEVPVRFLSDRVYGTALELAQALISGEEDIDLIVIRSNYIDIHQLIHKGYAADLRDVPALMDYVSTLHENMPQVASADGGLYMVPVGVNTKSTLAYSVQALDRLDGLALPKTYDDLMDLLLRWDADYGETHPDIVPISTANSREFMFRLALFLHKDATAFQGIPFSYQDPELMYMLKRALALPMPPDGGVDDVSGQNLSTYDKVALFHMDAWFDLEGIGDYLDQRAIQNRSGLQELAPVVNREFMMPRPLTVAGGETPSCATLTLMCVNPRSRNRDLAIAYIEKYIRNMDPAMRIMMSPDINTAVLNPDHAKELERMEERMAGIEKALESAEGASKTQLEQDLADAGQRYVAYSDFTRYSISPDAIDLYRELTANSYIDLSRYYLGLLGDDVNVLIRRVLDGQINLSQFVEEAEGRLRLMRLEGQE